MVYAWAFLDCFNLRSKEFDDMILLQSVCELYWQLLGGAVDLFFHNYNIVIT